MRSPTFRRIALPLLLFATLAAPAAASGPRRILPTAGQPTAGFFSWWPLVAWWAGLDGGCGIDPNGQCRQAEPPAGFDGGCGLDPSGLCRQVEPPAGLDGGCGIDPSGLCRQVKPPAGLDGGCGLDPDGCGLLIL
jgi:hypothetical protein